MRQDNSLFQVIKDPVYGSMQFAHEDMSWMLPLIDHESFQRLRHIKQIGLCDWFFVGAVHTRFNHSLGCCYVASQIAEKIGLSPAHKRIVMMAGLLHDIGHGPFSHTFEQLFHGRCIRHEMWTPHFIAEFSRPEFLTRLKNGAGKTVWTTAMMRLVERLIMHREKRHGVLADIVSSQLDADRLDYLLRDSRFCGVSYGQYDFSWLLNCLVTVKTHGKSRLGIVKNGIGAVEHYLMARRLMTRNVYHHAKKCAAEHLLVQFLKHLSQGLQTQEFASARDKTLAQFLMRVNDFNRKVHTAKDAATRDKMIRAFLRDNYEDYKQLGDYDVFSMIRRCARSAGTHPAAEIARRLHGRSLPKTCAVQARHRRRARKLIAELLARQTHLQSWQIGLLTLPRQSYYLSEDDPILIEESDGHSRLHERSLMMNAMSKRRESGYVVYIDRPIFDKPPIQTLCRQLQKLA